MKKITLYFRLFKFAKIITWGITGLLFSSTAQAKHRELVMVTTLSPDATAYIITRWQQQPDSVMIRTLYRTSASLEQLLETEGAGPVDIILTSSPMLLQHLQQHGRLMPHGYPAQQMSQTLVPESIRHSAVAVALSGFGLLINQATLTEKGLPLPSDWEDLTQAYYQGTVLMSSPSRSDTNHLMVEALLQQKGWQKGWETMLTASGNLVTISSRSFGVADKIKSGLGAVGPVIDNYANLVLHDPHLTFRYFPQSAASPTYIAITENSQNPENARHFIRFLLSPDGQQALSDTNTGKYPVVPLPADNPRAQRQQMLLNQPPPDYPLILKRQRMVQKLFDTAVSFRLSQLKDAWKALYAAESRLKRPLPEIRAMLTAVPVTEEQSRDDTFLNQFDTKSLSEQMVMEWQLFFTQQQRKAISELETLK